MSTVFGWTTALTLWRLVASRLIAYPMEETAPKLSMATCAMGADGGRRFGWTSFTVRDLAYHDIYPAPDWLHSRKDISEQEKYGIAALANDMAAIGYEVPRPFEVMVRDPGKRGGHIRGKRGEGNAAKGAQCFRPHAITGIQPEKAFDLLWDDMHIVSPEYLFVQMASVLKDPVLSAVLGCELTGYYALLPLGLVNLKKQKKANGMGNLLGVGFDELFDADGYVERMPLTTVDKLKRFVEEAPKKMYGIPCARAALPLVKDGSRSPMETVSSIQLRLSRRRGGFGAGDALFNKRIDIKAEWREVLGKNYLLVDELFGPMPDERVASMMKAGQRSHARKAKTVGAEYQGRYHASDWQMTADNQRRLALEDESMAIYFITGRDFMDERVWNKIGERIAFDAGHDYSEPTEAMKERRARVHEILANPNLLKY